MLLVVKRPVKRRQRAPRPVSPYSTDSNYSAILAAAPHRPYPKSERRRQLASGRQGRHHGIGRHGNQGAAVAAMSPALRPLPRELSLVCSFMALSCGLVLRDGFVPSKPGF